MKNVSANDQLNTTQQNGAEEIRGRSGERLAGKVNNPGGGGSQERVPAKGNDITHEDDLLQSDIVDEVDEALDEDFDAEQ